MFEIFIRSLSAEWTIEIKRKAFSRSRSMKYFYRTPTKPNAKRHKNTCGGSKRISWSELIKIMKCFSCRVLQTVTVSNDVNRFSANSAQTAFKHCKKIIIQNIEVYRRKYNSSEWSSVIRENHICIISGWDKNWKLSDLISRALLEIQLIHQFSRNLWARKNVTRWLKKLVMQIAVSKPSYLHCSS